MIVLCMQYWEGDKQRAQSVARLIADLQPQKDDSFAFMFLRRFDASPVDEETLGYVGRKFDLYTHTCRRKEVGWPAGCNGMASDAFMLAQEKWNRGEWKRVTGVWLLEADILPLQRNWLYRIEREWKMALEDKKLVMGAWSEHHSPVGHINGNMLFHPSLCDRVPGLEGSAPHIGWDVYHAHRLSRHWWKSNQMLNLYRGENVSTADLYRPGTKYAFVHGIKDDSGLQIIRRRFFENAA
jgi:hypothetical protein